MCPDPPEAVPWTKPIDMAIEKICTRLEPCFLVKAFRETTTGKHRTYLPTCAYLSNQDQPVLPAQHRNNNPPGVEPQGDENGANEGSDDSADDNVDLIGTVRRARHAEWP
jgi:hypothetical protein